MDLTSPERRKFARLDIKTLVKWEKIAAGKDSVLNDLDAMINVSRGGVCITVSRRLQKGDIISLQIKLSAKRNILTKGRVVWIKEAERADAGKKPEFDTGIEFLDMDNRNREELNHFLFDSFVNE